MIKTHIHLRGRMPLNGNMSRLLLVSVMLMMSFVTAKAQTINPIRYYSFEGSNTGADAISGVNLNFAAYGSQYTVGTNGLVGKFLTLNDASNLIDGGQMSLTNGLSIEFLLKPGYLFNTTKLFQRGDDAFSISIDFPRITFSTKHRSGSGAIVQDDWIIELDGIGRKSYGYYTDNNWHHIVFSVDLVNGLKSIWVDGQLPAGFSKSVATGNFDNVGNLSFYLNHSVRYVKYHGSIDELAIYNRAIPASLIYKHYLGVQNGQPYNFLNDYTSSIPPASAVTAGIDINEYAPGHPLVSVSAIDQIKSYPTPRYKSGNTLLKNFNWMDAKFLGGLFQPGVSQAQATTNSVVIQTELAKNFNYYFNVALGTGTFQDAWVTAANANPDFKLATTLFRVQLNGNNCEIHNQNKTASHYLQNASGQFLDMAGNVTSSKIWRPSAPVSSYVQDGNTTLASFNDLFSRLNRGLDMINENAELFPMMSDAAMQKDPVVTADKNSTGLDWQTYLARRYAENEVQAYRNIFMNHSRLANAKFTEYSVDGFPLYRMKYSEARKTNSLINGQYYSTPDFYTRWPNNWRFWTSAWHGWQWIVESRVNELALGDRLYSPFVAAGWDVNEENNVRPAQWLGLLKCLGATGAEFYYAGFFSTSAPWADSKNWVWQAAMPSYAQAITSRYEDFLRNGELMNGDVMNSYTVPTAPGYSFWAGDMRKLVVARKHNSGNKFVITGTIQPNNNMINSTESESVAQITIDNQLISFKVRRQGSTYIYDKSNPSAPVFYQLDGWHDKTHPSYWTKDFQFEAELFDNTNTQVNIKTSVPAGTASGDFTNATSYINFTSASAVSYFFTPRQTSATNYYLWVRARSKNGTSTGFTSLLNSVNSNTVDCIQDTNWVWYRYNTTNAAIAYANLSAISYELRITAINTNLEIDKIHLTTNSGAIYSGLPNPCSTAQATITPAGSTSFCQGGSVMLSASSGSSYLWSTGATTQNITATSSGTYTVTVTNNGVPSVASPVTVTVYTLPTATITAGGPTTFCSGGSVTLTSSSGSSYLWSPGNQTTPSITISSAGTYNVRVTNSNGCTKVSSNTTVTVNALPTATISAGGSTTFCQGGSVTLTSSSGSSYLWSPGNQTSQSITVSSGGTYSVRVTNSSGCTKISSNTVVTVNSLPTASITPSGSLNLIQGQTVTLTSSAGSSYLWSPGNQTTSSITVGAAGSYTVRVTNSSGCSAISTPAVVTMSTSVPAVITPAGATSFCSGGSVTLNANSGSAYLWSTGATTQSINIGTGGTYTVTVTNNGIPSVSSPVTVTVWSLPTATISAGGATTFCSGGSVTLTASSGSSYLWSPGNQTTQAIAVTAGGSYNVRVTNSNGCTKVSSNTSVTVNSLPTATITAGGPTTFCSGGSVTLTSSAGSSYLWSPGNQTSQSITVSSGGTYSVRVTNSSGCTKVSSNTTVNVNALPTATITAGGPTTFCSGGSVTLTSSSGSSYLWSPGNQTTPSITVNSGGTYSVRVTNSSGCTKNSSNTVVTVNSLPTANITPSGSLNLIQGQTVTLTSSAGSSYLWSPGNQTSQSITVGTAGSYTVRVTNSAGCSKTSAPAVVTVGTAVPATITPAGATSFCSGGSVTLSANSGTAYLWSTGATTNSITTGTAGNYTVTVTNNGIPSVSPATTVTVWSLPTATITASGSTTLCSGSSITLTASSASSYLWSPGGQTTQSITVSSAGTYNVTVSNSNGCTKTATAVTVSVITCSAGCDKPINLVTNNVTANSATLSWTSPNTGQTAFQVKLRNMSTYFTYVSGTVPSSTTTVTVSANSNTTYRWWVRSYCGTTKSTYAGYLVYTTYPTRPYTDIEADAEIHQITQVYPDDELLSEDFVKVVLDDNEVQLFPNPADNESSISFKAERDEVYSMNLLDMNGKVVFTESINAVEGFNIFSFELGELKRGFYFVQLLSHDKNVIKKLIVQ